MRGRLGFCRVLLMRLQRFDASLFEVLELAGKDGNRRNSAKSCSAHEVEFARWSYVQLANCEPGVLFVAPSSGHGRVLL